MLSSSSLLTTGCLFTALLALPEMSMAVQTSPCQPGTPTAESRTWNFRREASGLLKDVQTGAFQVQDDADQLRLFALNTNLDWQAHVGRLNEIKQDVNDMGRTLCRLEQIRRVTAPWQQQAIDRTALLVREMAANADQAIRYLNANHEHLWSPTYRAYASNLFQESQRLSQTVGNYEQLAKARRQERRLERSLGSRVGA